MHKKIFVFTSLIVLFNTSSLIAEQEERVIKFNGDSRENQFKKVYSSSSSEYNENNNDNENEQKDRNSNRDKKNRYNEDDRDLENNRQHNRRDRYNDENNNNDREYRRERESQQVDNYEQKDQTRYKKYVNSDNEIEYIPVVNNRESSHSVWSDGTIILELKENVNVKSFARINGLDFLKQNKNGKYIFKIEDDTEVVQKCNELLKVRGVIDARPNWRRENRYLK